MSTPSHIPHAERPAPEQVSPLLRRLDEFIGDRPLEAFVIGRLQNRDTRPFLGREGDETPTFVLSEALKLGSAFPRREELLKILHDRVMAFVQRHAAWNTLTEEDITEAYWLGGLIELRRPHDAEALIGACCMWLTGAATTISSADANDPAGRVAASAVEAATPYMIERRYVPLWRSVALAHPVAAALAFRAMLEAGATQREATETLALIEKHTREDGWPVAVEALRARTRNTFAPRPRAKRKPSAGASRSALP